MDVHVKIKYGCDKQNIESFGNNRYLIYLLSKKEEEESWGELIALLSRKLGVPENRIELRRNMGDNKVFFVN
jgi:uncharacterized protein YggU (UPF0235/DUF167 family)